MNDQCVIVTSNFAKWLRDLFPGRTDHKSFENFIWRDAIPNKKLPEGCYTMPAEFSTRHFPDKVIPSIAHDTELYHKGILKTFRSDDE